MKAKGPGAPKQEFPLHISAAQMEADQDQRLIIFKGQVKADYGDSTLYTDKLMVFYKPEEKTKGKGPKPSPSPGEGQDNSPLAGLGGDQIDRIEAWGNVRYVEGDRVATGEKAIYYKDKDEIVLLGHPQVWRGEDHLKGSKIIMHLASKKVEVESSPAQRVEAHLYPTTQGKTPPASIPSGGGRTVPRTGRPR
jgi:lipopolysaccharide export system protein LptA